MTLNVHSIGAPGVPLLLSAQTLTEMGAIVDFQNACMPQRAGIAPQWLRLATRHLTLTSLSPSTRAASTSRLFCMMFWSLLSSHVHLMTVIYHAIMAGQLHPGPYMAKGP